jgi:hypothetical protein
MAIEMAIRRPVYSIQCSRGHYAASRISDHSSVQREGNPSVKDVQDYPRGGMHRCKQGTWMGDLQEFSQEDSRDFGCVQGVNVIEKGSQRGLFFDSYFEEITI